MKNTKCFLKASAPLILFVLSLGYFVYAKVTGFTPFKFPTINEMKAYGPFLLPLIYVTVYLIRAGAALVFAFLLAGFIGELVPKQVMLNYLSSSRKSSYILAALISPLLTVCSCVMIPIFAGLVYAGAGVGPATSFLLTAPAANILAIVFTLDIIGWRIALARMLAAVGVAVLAGAIIAKTPWGRAIEEKYRRTSRVQARVEGVKIPLCERLWASFKLSGYLAKTILPYVLLGVGIVSYVQAYLPPSIVAAYLSGNIGIMLGAIIGVPMYTPTLVEVILVDALRHLGMSPAAALAFLIGGPMTSIPSMMGASRIVGWKVVLTYAIIAVVGAMAAGFLYEVFVGNAW